MSARRRDSTIERLARLFREHPAWVEAARHIGASGMSTVYFSHRPGEPWHLEQVDGESQLLPGAAPDPDFVFLFTPHSVERLEAVDGGVGDFAVELFTLMADVPREEGVRIRIVAGFMRLMVHGYVGLLLAAGPRVLAFGASNGIRSIGALRRFVANLRSNDAEEWEQPEQ